MSKTDKVVLTDLTVKSAPPAPEGKRDHIWDASAPGFGLRITDKGAKTFVYMRRVGGKPWWKTLGKPGDIPLKDARDAARKLNARIALGENPAAEEAEAKVEAQKPPAPPAAVYTVAKAVAAYEKAHISRLKPRSQKEARRPLELVLMANWAALPLADLTKAEIREVLAEMAEEAPVAANRALTNIRAFLNWCLSEDRIEANPCAGIRPPGGDEKPRDRVLSPSEIATIWPLMAEASYPFGTLAQLLLVTAQRRSEVANMRWSDIADLEGVNPVWTIPADRNKGGRLHEVPLSPMAVAILRSIPRIAVALPSGKAPVLSDWVFTTNGTDPFSGFSGGKERLDEMTAAELAKADDPATIPAWIIHDLRRTAASGMARAGTPPHIVSRVLNHSPGKAEGITAIYNRHGYLVEKRAALDSWEATLESIVSGGTCHE